MDEGEREVVGKGAEPKTTTEVEGEKGKTTEKRKEMRRGGR